jgi:hypothetical protein
MKTKDRPLIKKFYQFITRTSQLRNRKDNIIIYHIQI